MSLSGIPSSAGSDLQFVSISKKFSGVSALSDVSFTVQAGSVRALMGENGAGKSTLLKILSGAYTPSIGTMRIGGQAHRFSSTSAALAAGIAVIYQELHLVPEMTVAENIFLGHMPSSAGILRRGRLRQRAAAQLAVLGEDIHPDTKVSRLPIAQRQIVEIAKALTRGAQVIAFDEPTSSLSEREVQKLFSVIRDLRARGCAILYVTHRMEEVFQVCDSVTVLRDGCHVWTAETLDQVTPETLVQKMVGRDIANVYNYRPRERGAELLRVEEMLGPGLSEPANLTVSRGEIVGIFGLVGAGRSELLNLIFGARRARSGTIMLEGKPAPIRAPSDAIQAGIVLCPEDRKAEGIIPVASVQENLNLSARRHHLLLRLFISGRWERGNAIHQITRLRIRTPSPQFPLGNLSGGNQQKVVLARWMAEQVKVLLVDEPTRGIDVGSRSEIYAIMQELAEQGVGILVVSSDLPEILGISDRVLVMRQGAIVASLARPEATRERVLELALPISDSSQRAAIRGAA